MVRFDLLIAESPRSPGIGYPAAKVNGRYQLHRGEPKDDSPRPLSPGYVASRTAIFLGFNSGFFGRWTLTTPLAVSAVILSASTLTGIGISR